MSGMGWGEAGAGSAIAGAITARAPRPRTCLLGKLVYDDGFIRTGDFSTLDCGIHNLSDGGAKVTIAQHQPLPASLYLIVIKYSVAHRAEMAWMQYPSRGLRFRETYRLEDPIPGGVTFLHNVWADIHSRAGVVPRKNG